MMNDDLDWTEALGAAVVDRLPDVQASVQQIRAEMQAAGALESNDKQKVIIDQDTIKIETATRDVIYVPIYQPLPDPPVVVPAAPPAPAVETSVAEAAAAPAQVAEAPPAAYSAEAAPPAAYA